MAHARWREIEALFLAAREREPSVRATFLKEACGADAALRQEVESLLAADQGATGFLEPPGVRPLAAPDLKSLLDAELAGRYTLEVELGRGGMATVYLAEDVRHHRRVALKVLHPELGALLGAERFAREIAIAARLSHPHILPLHDSGSLTVGAGPPVLFYAMPYVASGSLRARLREEPQLPIDEALRITRQVAEALDHAHRHGIIHRDIKPENILLAEREAVVADFGIARAVDAAGGERLTETGLALGTPAYMSPEQAAGSARLDARSDIYSLGCVLYEMLAGQPPFPGPSSQAILARHAVDPVPALRTVRPTVPLALEQVVTRALAKVPADRFRTARAFAEALTAAPSAVVAPARGRDATTTVTPPPREVRRRRWLVAAVAGLAIVAAGLATALGRKPAELMASRVLVMPFQNRTGDSTLNALGDAAADYIARGLRRIHGLEVIDARSQAAGEAGRRLDPAGARALARAARAGNVVLGAYDRAPGDSLQFQAEVLETRTGRSLRLIAPVNAPAADRPAALEGVRTRVMAAMSTTLNLDFTDATSLPSTYEAAEEYEAGIGAWNNCGGQPVCRERAFEHFRRAAAMDSDFTLPLTTAAYRFWRVGDCTRVDSIAAALRPRLDHMPPEDWTHLLVATDLCRGDQAAALHAINDGLNDAPGNFRLLDLKEMVLLRSNRPREAIEVPGPHDPDHAPQLLGAYHRLGMYDRALEFIAEGRRRKLDDVHLESLRELFVSEEIASLAALGRVAEVARMMDDAARRFGADRQGLRVTYLFEDAGQELAAHGHPTEAKAAFDRAIAWAKAQPAEQQATSESRRALASVLNSAGRWEEARTVYQALAAADTSDGDAQAMLGDLAARRGDRAEAERVDRWLAAHGRTGRAGAASESWALYQRARIAGLLGDREHAIGLLRGAAQKGFDGWRDAHLDPDLAPLRADPAFQEWLRPKD